MPFEFDDIFTSGKEEDAANLYDKSVKPLVLDLFKGYNATILAYGQTASGKTYTMGAKNNTTDGVIPKAIDEIFDQARLMKVKGYVVDMECSFVEIKGNDFKDLLSPKSKQNMKVSVFANHLEINNRHESKTHHMQRNFTILVSA